MKIGSAEYYRERVLDRLRERGFAGEDIALVIDTAMWASQDPECSIIIPGAGWDFGKDITDDDTI